MGILIRRTSKGGKIQAGKVVKKKTNTKYPLFGGAVMTKAKT